ncbi:small ribosomal subunit protein uS13m-like [Euphorbia lathyris]|uniref:small ribosomal subunit protein uS13m-like n=1 Tax=Euphorbia lathyris TaxID=212925 RepID=UPI0033132CB9
MMFGHRGSVRLLADIKQRLLNNFPLHSQRVQCLHVGNTNIPDNKRLEVALQYISGIGRRRAHQILVDLSIENKHTKDLTGLELHFLKDEVSKYITGQDLKRCVQGDIQRLMGVQSYRGYNHACSLPCRGQRTSTNARTKKGQRNIDKTRYQSLAESMQRCQGRS